MRHVKAPPPRLRSSSGLVLVATFLSAWVCACAHERATPSRPPGPMWINASTANITADTEAHRLRQLAARDKPGPQLARLDRLLDLFDAARFGEDAGAREALWRGLGSTETSRGTEATRSALSQLLQEAWSTEDRFTSLSEDARQFLSDLIMITSVDLNTPADTEGVRIRALAYRELSATGHPRIRDNATWRLYDHVRGVLAAAVKANPARRHDIAAHALYAVQDEISAYLQPDATGILHPLPGAGELCALLTKYHTKLGQSSRWREVMRVRIAGDAELLETARVTLPQARAASWKLPTMPRGTGRQERYAPIVLAAPDRLRLAPGSPTAKTMPYGDTALPELLAAHTAGDGRGMLLLALDPLLPSPDLRALLRGIAASRVSTFELALHEPETDTIQGPDRAPTPRLTVLPVHVFHQRDTLAASQPFVDARIHVHLGGVGPSIRVDGRRLATPRDDQAFQAKLDELRRAYPNEHAATFSLGPDVLARQLTDLVATLVGGSEPRFFATAWLPDAPPTASHKVMDDQTIADRLAALAAAASPRLDQPYPLREADQIRLDTLVRSLRACVAELESAQVVTRSLRIALTFDRGVVERVVVQARRVERAKLSAMQACAEQHTATFRLREHRDRFRVGLRFSAPAP